MNILVYTGMSPQQMQQYGRLEQELGASVYPLAQSWYDQPEVPIGRLGDALQAITRSEEQLFAAMLLAVVHCAGLRADSLHGREQELFLAACSDIGVKLNECLAYKKTFGIFVLNWYHGLLKAKRVAMGRLQFDLGVHGEGTIDCGIFRLRTGDRKLQCHIPSGMGPLTQSACMEAFRQAWETFPEYRQNGIVPILCDSWLLYPPYAQVFADSNVGSFRKMWTLYRTARRDEFADCWRIFSMDLPQDLSLLPCNTRMQRNFVGYITDGGDFGAAAGIVLFDGNAIVPVSRAVLQE